LAEVLNLFLWCLVLVLVLDILDYVEKGAAPLLGQLGGGMQLKGFCPCFPWSYGPSIRSGSSEVVSSEGSIWFLLSIGQVEVGPVVAHYQFVQGCLICSCFARWQLHCLTAATLAGQLLPQQSGEIQFCTPPSLPPD
jgi:hypothetical protein